jgi:multidrug efflux pump
VRGLGLANGFTLQLLNNSNLTREEFENRRDRLLLEASRAPELTAVRATAVNDAPALRIDIDQMKVSALGVAPQDVYQTLTAAWAGAYINDFVDRGRAKRVHMQGDAPYRSAPSDLDAWSVRSADGQMVSFAAFSTTSWSTAPTAVSRFAGLPSHEIQGQAAPGRSSGEAMSRIAALADEIPGVSVAWSGLSYQERTSSGQTTSLYVLSLVVVFLCLAALYESWSIPFAVLLVVPLGVLGAVLAGTLRGLQNDIFFQIGLVTTMGLAAKNAILIVEFADRAHKGGKSAVQAALDASRLRLRPIIMTSAAFSAGVLPLAVAVGAGARSRIAIGTTVLGGVLASTLLTILYVPAFFVLLRRLSSGVASVGARTPPGDPAGPGTVGRGRAPRPSLPTSD